MYICVCRAVNERHIREEVAQGACTVADLQAHCGLGTCCGSCIPVAETFLQQVLTESQLAARNSGNEVALRRARGK